MEIPYFESQTIARRAYDRVMQPVCRAWDLSRNELDTLLFLGNNPGLDRAADIVRCRGLTKSHVSAAVADLEQRGFLACRKDDADRRSIRLMLTPRGEAVAEEGRQAQKAFFAELFRGLTEEQLDQWRQMMLTVTDNITRMRKEQ